MTSGLSPATWLSNGACVLKGLGGQRARRRRAQPQLLEQRQDGDREVTYLPIQSTNAGAGLLPGRLKSISHLQHAASGTSEADEEGASERGAGEAAYVGTYYYQYNFKHKAV